MHGSWPSQSDHAAHGRLEMPNKTMKSVSGHSKDDEVSRYTEAASQKKLADGALNQLAAWELANSSRCKSNS